MRQTCLPDSENSEEWITSLYFDSDDLEQYEGSSSGDSRKDKVRIRWYYSLNDYQYSVPVYIEHKTREGFIGTKQRKKIIVPVENLDPENLRKGIVLESQIMDTLAGFGYFPSSRIKPVIVISYYRHHFTDLMSGMRVSLDYNIRSSIVSNNIGCGEKELKLAGGIIEIKGTTMELPMTLQRVKILELDWTRFSKYSACLETHMSEPWSMARLWPREEIRKSNKLKREGVLYVEELFSSSIDVTEAIVSIGFSLVASIIVYFMYQVFYGSKNIGAGVHRTFLIGGPAITTLFLGIQTSIPLSLGLLGALSFVRFRTPVKDPAEIGFLLLLIASSIGAATSNYVVIMMLLAVVLITLSVQSFLRNKFTMFGRGQLMISVDKASYAALDKNLNEFLNSKLGSVKLENLSTIDNRVSLHYIYRKKGDYNWGALQLN